MSDSRVHRRSATARTESVWPSSVRIREPPGAVRLGFRGGVLRDPGRLIMPKVNTRRPSPFTCSPNPKITGLTWIVERSFAWLGRNRRLSKDYEYSVQTSETLIDIASTRLILNRSASA